MKYTIYGFWSYHWADGTNPYRSQPLALTLFPLGETAISFLFKESPLNKTLRSREWRKWLSTKEALDCSTNSPCQHVRKCIENIIVNMHTDVRMQRVLSKSITARSIANGPFRWSAFWSKNFGEAMNSLLSRSKLTLKAIIFFDKCARFERFLHCHGNIPF